jgi:UDP-glucose 4-epimerase
MDKTKNILITGGAGYIGSHIVEALTKTKNNIFIIDNLSTGFKKLINKKAFFFDLNILNTKKIRKIILTNQIDSVIHLAASVSIGAGEKYPKIYFRNNVTGTINLLNACKNSSVKNFIFSSTAAIYKDGQKIVNENSKISPKSVYGKTKLKAEKQIITICKKNKINYSILRYFNVCGASLSGKIGLIGKGDHLFKNISSSVIKKKPIIKIYGNNYNTSDGTTIRDYIHVSDLANIHLEVLRKISAINKSKIINCGYGRGTSVLEVVNAFKKQIKKKIKINFKKRRAGDMEMIIANNKSLLRFINWKPKYNNLDKIVKSCLIWEKKL